MTLVGLGVHIGSLGAVEFYVAPDGSAGGDGTVNDPWDLDTALAHPAAVVAGQNPTTVPDGAGGTIQVVIIWLRGGNYGSLNKVFTPALTGTATNPIVLKQFPKEHAIVDGTWNLNGCPFLWLMGFESFNSDNIEPLFDTMGFDTRSEGVRQINLIIRDHLGNGIGTWVQAPDAKVYGSIIYNNGRKRENGFGTAHGVYIQNNTGTKNIADSFIFHNGGSDIHGFGSGGAFLKDATLERVVGINWGDHNLGPVWRAGTMDSNAWDGVLGYNIQCGLGPNSPVGNAFTFKDCYIYVKDLEFKRFDPLTVTDCTVIHLTQNVVRIPGTTFPSWTYDNNDYFRVTGGNATPFIVYKNEIQDTNRNFADWQTDSGYDAGGSFTINTDGVPTTNKIFLHPNLYENGRANIIVFNWEDLSSVNVDVSSVLSTNQKWEVRHVFDFYGTRVASGTYSGSGTINIPINVVEPVVPSTGWQKGPDADPPTTPPIEFSAYVLLGDPLLIEIEGHRVHTDDAAVTDSVTAVLA